MTPRLGSLFARAVVADPPGVVRGGPLPGAGGRPRPSRNRPLRDLVQLARPTQWLKNVLVVPLALIGVPGLGPADLAAIGWVVLAFCLAASVVYVWNDIADRHRDRAHPVKRDRPVAAGRITVTTAAAYGTGLAALLLVVLVFGPAINWWPLLAYLVLNIAYSRWLKQVPLLDVFVVAAGFLLRVIQGYVALAVPPASMLLIAVFALCLLLIIGKRRHEVNAAGLGHRPALAGISSQFLEYLMVLCGAVAVTGGLLYLNDERAAGPQTDAVLLLSVPFAIFALARYLQLVVVRSDGGDPVRVLLRDPVIRVTALVWAVVVVAVVALPAAALELIAPNPRS